VAELEVEHIYLAQDQVALEETLKLVEDLYLEL
jgi:hypothetical protein